MRTNAPPRFEKEPDIVLSESEFVEQRAKIAKRRVGTLVQVGDRFIQRADGRRRKGLFNIYTEAVGLFENS